MEHPAIPEQIGHFRVVGRLGEGGMGTVYVGVDETLERRVALKVIRAEHRLNPAGKARFLREARILSRLDHPGICKLYDFIEGDDEDCLVLELIDGTSLLRGMTESRWTLDEKLQIARKLLDVLVVVHAEGIIHRDLTPLNVMITPASEVKVLDFGLARVAETNPADEHVRRPPDLTASELDDLEIRDGRQTIVIGDRATADAGDRPHRVEDTDATCRTSHDPSDPETNVGDRPTGADRFEERLETRDGAVLGTAAYMSPEQARGEPVTAASDMYSFGLILQELLTGKPPYPTDLDPRELRRRSLFAQTEPVIGLPADLTTLIRRLTSVIPASRPSSVDAAEMLQAIIDRPSRQRKRRLVAAVWVALGLFGAGMTVQYLRAERESERAEQQAARAAAEATAAHQVSEFLVGLFEVSDPGRGDGSDVTARELLDTGASKIDAQLAAQPVAHARLAHVMGVVYHHLGELDRARQMLLVALGERESELGADHADVAETLFELGLVTRYAGDYEEARERWTRGLEIVETTTGPDYPGCARFLHQLAILDQYEGDLEGAESRLERALEIYETEPHGNAEGIAEVLGSLASVAENRQQFDLAEARLRRALAIDLEVHGPNSLEEAGMLSNLATVLLRSGRPDEAEQAVQRALSITEARLGTEHAFTAGAVNGLAHFYYSQGRYDEAVEQLRRAHRIYVAAYGPDHSNTAIALSNLGMVLLRQGNLAEAEKLLTDSYETMSSSLGLNNIDVARVAFRLAGLKERLGKPDEAMTLYRRVLSIQEDALGPDSPAATATRERLANL
jgi:serine/threonine protein kinase/tetratricopeptide (TPR) repeat protein